MIYLLTKVNLVLNTPKVKSAVKVQHMYNYNNVDLYITLHCDVIKKLASTANSDALMST